jgi:hypothetical protein
MNEQATPSLLVIVPRAQSEACQRLQQALDGSGTRVVLDRRSIDRTAPSGAQKAERRADGRTRSERNAALSAGKWIVVPGAAEHVNVLDADARAILFLYCSPHNVPCERCQETYRLGWVVRTDTALSCPKCGDDLTSIVVAHALRCPNWVHRRPGGSKPAARMDGPAAPRRSAAG